MFNEFFAVTTTSVYRVFYDKGKHVASATKIASNGKSEVPVGHDLKGGYMIAICDQLIAYCPEGSGRTSPTSTFERKIEMVNTTFWGGRTSKIIALFETEAEACSCLSGNKNLEPCDPRWRAETKEVLTKIGDNHPGFEICHWGSMDLMAPAMARYQQATKSL